MRSRAAVVAMVTVLGLSLGGCGLLDRLADPSRQEPIPSEQPPSDAAAGLERFYGQQLSWSACGSADCATLKVPMDYAHPEGPELDIAVLRVRATSSKRLGAIVVNPGGPGGSGVDYARAAGNGWVVSAPVLRRYDVVGFDPRGVGRSTAISCLSDQQLDEFFAQDPTPDDPSEEAQAATLAAAFGRGCATSSGSLAAHISTVEAAKDMDILRSRLGQPSLNYLGMSYGTLLGATYAGLFPERVGRMVLDGALPPDLSSQQINQGQAEGFERATAAWAQDCAGSPTCPFSGSAADVVAGLQGLLATLDSQPITDTGDASVPAVTEGWAAYAVVAAMYDQGRWDSLNAALRDAQQGKGAQLLDLASTYTDRFPGGGYSSNMQEAFYAITCLDKGESPDLNARRAEADRVQQLAPTFGRLLVWSSLPCGFWPRPADAPQGTPEPVTAPGAAPIVVVGTTRDPATPYEWAQQLAAQLESGVLLTYDGDGHTAYQRSNSCIDNAIDGFFLNGTVPADGLRC